MKANSSNSFGQCGSGRGSPAEGPDPDNQGLQIARHQAQCRVCRHPQREEIDRDYLDWVGPRELAQTYNLASDRAIYRHTHALGLVERRRANPLGALDRIIERVGEVNLTAGAIVSAIRLSAQLAREAAAASDSPRQGIVLAFTGMPQSDAVRPRRDAEEQNQLSAGEPTPSENRSPRNNASSRKRPSRDRKGAEEPEPAPPAAARPSRDRKGAEEPEPAPPAAARPSRDRKRAEGLGHSPHADSHSRKRQQAAVAIPTAPPGTPNPGGLW